MQIPVKWLVPTSLKEAAPLQEGRRNWKTFTA